MNVVLVGFDRKKVTVFVDDILIASETVEENMKLLERVLEHLGETVCELKGFLGLIEFGRKFIRDCLGIRKPLTEWTGKKNCVKLKWDERMMEAFERLKEEASRDVTLAFPDYSEEASKLELYADANLENKSLVESVDELRAKLMSEVQKERAYTEEQGMEEEMIANGLPEMTVRMMTEILRMMSKCDNNWDKYVGRAVWVYNSTLQKSIGMSPSKSILRLDSSNDDDDNDNDDDDNDDDDDRTVQFNECDDE
ncbi:unconventional prefoldin RPB5 interactor 1-like [Macrobrachium nipponense]|uniref:unconventional prefoldin RPB5 interactor 1-like n=1 Tax=Macrobrachium nipponense TaxID=159736 RepID=UPI0030C8C220